jgi:hypothetical protein
MSSSSPTLSVDDLFDASFWLRQVDDGGLLSIGAMDASSLCNTTPSLDDINLAAEWRNRLDVDGYTQMSATQTRAESIMSVQQMRALKQFAERMDSNHGLQASFIFAFDQCWALAARMEALVKLATESANRNSFDVLAWLVDPSKRQSGFAPHRDRQPDDAAATFRGDGSPMYATCWLALAEHASADNGCLYVVPRWADPGYVDGDPTALDAPNPLARALPDKQSYCNIRALPRERGACNVFSHRILHWGSVGRVGAPHARFSISVACSDDSYEPPYLLGGDVLPLPPFELRIALIAAQMIVYHERFSFSAPMLSLFHRAFERHQSRFHERYIRLVQLEYIGALKELDEAKADDAGDDGDDDDSEDDEAMERALELMLAHNSDIDDDYDDYEQKEEEEDNEEKSKESDDDDDDDDEGFESALEQSRKRQRKQ